MSEIRFCTKCGTKVEEKAKYCSKCGNPLFVASFVIKGGEQEHKHIKSEEDAANTIIADLGVDKSLFEYVKPSESYSTIQYKGVDFFRIKYTDNSKWIQIPMSTPMRKANMENPLFEVEENKNKVFWKSNITNLLDYKDLLLEVIQFRDK